MDKVQHRRETGRSKSIENETYIMDGYFEEPRSEWISQKGEKMDIMKCNKLTR